MKLLKKGDLTINYIVLFALALIVLVIVVLIFKFGMDEFVGKLKALLKDIMAMKPELKPAEK